MARGPDSDVDTMSVRSRPPTAMSVRSDGRPSVSPPFQDVEHDRFASVPLAAWGMGVSAPQHRQPVAPSGARPNRRTVAEENMERRWLTRRHREVIEKARCDEENKALKAWGENKARHDEEITRNAEAARMGSVLQRREYKMPADAATDVYRLDETIPTDGSGGRQGRAPEWRDVSQPAVAKGDAAQKAETPVPTDLHEQMLRQIRRMNSHLLHSVCGDIDEAPANVFGDGEDATRHISLSPYLQADQYDGVAKATAERTADETSVLEGSCALWCNKHSAGSTNKANSDTDTQSLDALRLKQLEEVERIKRSFGHHNVPCFAETLEGALVMPAQKLKRGVGLCSGLPRLLINPFYEGVKQGKGKKGKKKRGK